MLALVVYESMFGNTKQIAEAVAEGVGAVLPVKTLEVRIAPVAMASDVDLLVVGGPTHIRGMSTERTRASAAAQPAHRTASDTIGICEWLEQLETPGANRMAAAFDTRVNAPQVLTGSAARGYAKRLAKAGFPSRPSRGASWFAAASRRLPMRWCPGSWPLLGPGAARWPAASSRARRSGRTGFTRRSGRTGFARPFGSVRQHLDAFERDQPVGDHRVELREDRAQAVLLVDDLDEHRQVGRERQDPRRMQMLLRPEALDTPDNRRAGDAALAEELDDRVIERPAVPLVRLADVDPGEQARALDLHPTALPNARPTTTATSPRRMLAARLTAASIGAPSSTSRQLSSISVENVV